MEVICFEDRALYALVDKLEAYIDSKKPQQPSTDKWISGEEAMRMMRISSKTTLQKFETREKSATASPKRKSSCMMPTAFAILSKTLLTKLFNTE